MFALTRDVSDSINGCELTHVARESIDVELARRQHRAYEYALERAGCRIIRARPAPDLPDAVFVEDVAVVLDEVAIVARPGAPSRRREVDDVAEILGRSRDRQAICEPGTLDGGDVLIAGRSVFVGRSVRTNEDGIAQLRRIVEPLGYRVAAVNVRGCLHLKSAVTSISEHQLLINPEWADAGDFARFDLVPVDPSEPNAANILSIDGTHIYSSAFPRTRDRLQACGVTTIDLDMSELAKAEGALTCCSIILREPIVE